MVCFRMKFEEKTCTSKFFQTLKAHSDDVTVQLNGERHDSMFENGKVIRDKNRETDY